MARAASAGSDASRQAFYSLDAAEDFFGSCEGLQLLLAKSQISAGRFVVEV